MTENKKPLKLEFAPGCFDLFEGTQDELNEFIAEIKNIFEGKTAEEIEAMSDPVDWDNLDPEEQELLEKRLNNSNTKH